MHRLRSSRRLPVGPRADARRRSSRIRSRRPTRSPRRSTQATIASCAPSSATCSCRSSSMPRWRASAALRDRRRHRRDQREDGAPPSARVRRRAGQRRRRGAAQLVAHQGRRAPGQRRHVGARRRAARDAGAAARAATRRESGTCRLRLGRRDAACSTSCARSWASSRRRSRAATPRTRRAELGDLLYRGAPRSPGISASLRRTR